MNNGQSAAKLLSIKIYGEGSTTISQESTGNIISGKQPIYLKERNVIYYIKCITSNKYYIGQASYFDKRIGTHVALLRRNKHKNPHLQNAWNKYGESNFVFKILEKCLTKEEMFDREKYYMEVYNTLDRNFGYNMCKDTRSKLGCKLSDSVKKAISDFHKGRKFSKKRIENLRRDAALRQGKPVLVYDKEMNFICEYNSISEASRQLNVNASSICHQCINKTGHIRKRKDSLYIFRYKDIV